jgi:hypothetical protein
VSYCTPTQLEDVARLYGMQHHVPHVDAALLDAASRDVDRYLGAPGGYDVSLLDPEQGDALRDATATQALFRLEQGALLLGTDDGISSVQGMSFSLRALPRFSAEAADRLVGTGLFRRTGSLPIGDVSPIA